MLSLPRIQLWAVGNNLCPVLAQWEQHPLQNPVCAASSSSCPEERGPLPPSHLPFSLLTFLAPLLKQLNSLDFFFFSFPFLVFGSQCNLP